MKVRMVVQISGTRNGQEWPARGSVIELPDAEGAEYCRNGMAEPVTTFRDSEAAVPRSAEEQRGLTTSTGPAKRSKR